MILILNDFPMSASLEWEWTTGTILVLLVLFLRSPAHGNNHFITFFQSG